MIRIVTDSASDISKEFAEEYNITVIPMTVRFGDKEYKDGVTLTGEEFFLKLVETDELPKTSQVTPFEFQKIFEQYKDDEILCITMSSKLSGTYQSACIASEEYPNVSVVDSLNVTVGERILILYALKLIEEGKPRTEIEAILNEEKLNIRLVALLGTLEYLKKGGRIGALSYALGSMLNLKPVIEIIDGKVIATGKARGSRAGNNILREKTKEYGIDFAMPYALAYSGLSDVLLKKYIEDSSDIYGNHDVSDISLIGSTIGTHIGPGAIAVAFFRKK